MKKTIKPIILCLLISVVLSLFLHSVSANGGDQRISEDKYLVNLARAPFTPQIGIKTNMLVSFVDIQKKMLINETILVKIRIAKFNEENKYVFESNQIKVEDGILEFSYTFNNSGLHEIFFDFAFASNPKIMYKVPDFLLDVQELNTKASKATSTIMIIFTVSLVSLLVGFIIGFLLGKKNAKKKYY